jgi:ribosomal protein L31E
VFYKEQQVGQLEFRLSPPNPVQLLKQMCKEVLDYNAVHVEAEVSQVLWEDGPSLLERKLKLGLGVE